MITLEIYEAGLIRRSWKFRFVGGNGEKFGHQYNSYASAREAAQKLISPTLGVELRVVHRDGTVWKLGRIR